MKISCRATKGESEGEGWHETRVHTGSLYRLTNSPLSFEDEARARFAKETRRRNKRGVCGGRKRSGQRERKQKRRGAIRSMATLPARSPHTMHAPVLTCVPPCACPSSPHHPCHRASFSAPALPPSLSSCIRKFAIHLTLPGATIRLIAPSLDRERATSSPIGSSNSRRIEQPRDYCLSFFSSLLSFPFLVLVTSIQIIGKFYPVTQCEIYIYIYPSIRVGEREERFVSPRFCLSAR